MSVENMLPQGSNRMTTEVTPTTSAQNVNPDPGYLFSRVTVKAIPILTLTGVCTKKGQNTTLVSDATSTAFRYLICVASSYNDGGNITFSGTATLMRNYSCNFDGDYLYACIVRNASAGVKFSYGDGGQGRMNMIVFGFNY